MSNEVNNKDQLWNVCKEFINEQQISCAESVYQSDEVILNAPELIEKICDLCGYYEYPEDE